LLQCEKSHSAESRRVFKQPGMLAGRQTAGKQIKWKPVTIRALSANHSRLSMKLHSSNTEKYQTVTGYDQSGVEINAKRYDYSVLVMPETPPRAWNVTPLRRPDRRALRADRRRPPDVVVLGTGERQRFVHPRLIASLAGQRIGVESMDSHAACRTYNILMGEGRKVTLALDHRGREGPRMNELHRNKTLAWTLFLAFAAVLLGVLKARAPWCRPTKGAMPKWRARCSPAATGSPPA
jgi:uncharacterized protein